jgi:D-threonine aldolase
MRPEYAIRDPSNIPSPGLLFYKSLIRQNIAQAVTMAGGPTKLRPHVKTHKTPEIVRLEQDAGIRKHKCATLAEAEMLARCAAVDVLVAYPVVGPNIERLAHLMQLFPRCHFSVLADHPLAIEQLSKGMASRSLTVDVLLDVDVGMHRTGIAPGPLAVALYEALNRLPGLRPDGLHAYDGQNHQDSWPEREASARRGLDAVLGLRTVLEKKGLPVPRLVLGGTPTFPVFARLDMPGVECSPGTCFLHDAGYGSKFPDLPFVPAALLLTRVISKPLPNHVTLDLGHKAVAGDPPAGQRCQLLDVPDCRHVTHSEEHLVIETPVAANLEPGDVVYAIPSHVCPTCALHRQAYVVENGEVTGTWEIVARDRILRV